MTGVDKWGYPHLQFYIFSSARGGGLEPVAGGRGYYWVLSPLEKFTWALTHSRASFGMHAAGWRPKATAL